MAQRRRRGARGGRQDPAAALAPGRHARAGHRPAPRSPEHAAVGPVGTGRSSEFGRAGLRRARGCADRTDDRAGHRGRHRCLCAQRRARKRCGLRRYRDPRRARLPDRYVFLGGDEPAHGPLGRLHCEPRAVRRRGRARDPCGDRAGAADLLSLLAVETAGLPRAPRDDAAGARAIARAARRRGCRRLRRQRALFQSRGVRGLTAQSFRLGEEIDRQACDGSGRHRSRSRHVRLQPRPARPRRPTTSRC